MSGNEIDQSVLRDIWLMFQRQNECSVDRMVCTPELRNKFVTAARRVCGTDDEFTILWTAMNERKKKAFGEMRGVDDGERRSNEETAAVYHVHRRGMIIESDGGSVE